MARRTAALGVGFALVGALMLPVAASAADIEVTTQADTFINDADCSLREAIQAANTNLNTHETDCVAGTPTPDTVFVDHGLVYDLTRPPDGTPDDNADGDLDIVPSGGAITVTWPSNGTGDETVIDGNNLDRIFDIQVGMGAGILTLDGIVLDNGSAMNIGDDGGAIRVLDGDAQLTLLRTVVRNSDAADYGGGISFENAADGMVLSLTDVLMSGNTAADHGGAVYFERNPGTTTGPLFDRSTFAGNSSGGAGGAYYQGAEPTAVPNGLFRNSTLSGNSAAQGGGAIGMGAGGSGLDLYFSTVTGNSTPMAGRAGGIQKDLESQSLDFRGSILGGNTSAGVAANCAEIPPANGTFNVALGQYNLESAQTCNFSTAAPFNNLVNTDPLLAPLANSGFGGGFTPVHGLYDTSPAVDRVPRTPTDFCAAAAGFDQRGDARPIAPDLCNAGSVEGSVGPVPVVPTVPVTPAPLPAPKKKCKKGRKLKKGKCVKKKKKRK